MGNRENGYASNSSSKVFSYVKDSLRVLSVCAGLLFPVLLPAWFGTDTDSRENKIICLESIANSNSNPGDSNPGDSNPGEKSVENKCYKKCYRVVMGNENNKEEYFWGWGLPPGDVPASAVATGVVGSVLFLYLGFRRLELTEEGEKKREDEQMGVN